MESQMERIKLQQVFHLPEPEVEWIQLIWVCLMKPRWSLTNPHSIPSLRLHPLVRVDFPDPGIIPRPKLAPGLTKMEITCRLLNGIYFVTFCPCHALRARKFWSDLLGVEISQNAILLVDASSSDNKLELKQNSGIAGRPSGTLWRFKSVQGVSAVNRLRSLTSGDDPLSIMEFQGIGRRRKKIFFGVSLWQNIAD